MTADIRILFILKRRLDFNPVKHSPLGLSTGLFNSANFMNEMINNANTDSIESEIEVAIDNNCIDRLVRKHNPTHVIIEALWVIPSKFNILTNLHPTVNWIVRLHSEMPFIASEGNALDWIAEYVTYNKISIGVNAPRMLDEMTTYLQIKQNWSDEECNKRVFYMPNYYPQDYKTKEYQVSKEYIDIACFGAIRPLKNHVLQAFAALKFAQKINKKLRFHINTGRIEMKGDPVLNNLKGLFQLLSDCGHELVGHEWRPRDEFLDLCSTMDIGLQCNFSETFNIVSADLISQGIPIVGSYEIPWADARFNARPAESNEICDALLKTHSCASMNVLTNQRNLTKYTNTTEEIWVNYFIKELK